MFHTNTDKTPKTRLFADGSYTLTVEFFDARDAGGTLIGTSTLHFSVLNVPPDVQ